MRDLLAERLAQPGVGEAHQQERIVLAAQELGRDAMQRNPQAVGGPDVHAHAWADRHVAGNVALTVDRLAVGQPQPAADHGRPLRFADGLAAVSTLIPCILRALDRGGPLRRRLA
jgi:hypothetical protein